jgi:hypothetical protein
MGFGPVEDQFLRVAGRDVRISRLAKAIHQLFGQEEKAAFRPAAARIEQGEKMRDEG